MKINRRERKAVRSRDYVKAQYYKVQHLRRQLRLDEGDLVCMTKRRRAPSFLWTTYHN